MSPAVVNRGLAAIALVLGTTAAIAGARPDPGPLAVAPLTLAEWIRERRNIRVLDLRDPEGLALFQLPTAEPPDGPLASLAATPRDTLVLVDHDGRASADSALALRAAAGRVLWLRGGVAAWGREVLNPTIAEDAPDSAFARFGRVAELSRYFGGVPRIVPAGGGGGRGDLEATMRRGCGFD